MVSRGLQFSLLDAQRHVYRRRAGLHFISFSSAMTTIGPAAAARSEFRWLSSGVHARRFGVGVKNPIRHAGPQRSVKPMSSERVRRPSLRRALCVQT